MFVAGFIGSPQMNLIQCKLEEADGKVSINFDEESIMLPEDSAKVVKDKGYAGKEVVLGIRPENIYEGGIYENENTVIEASVELTELLGAETYLYLSKGKSNITAKVSGSSEAKTGDKLKISLNINKIYIFDKHTEMRIL